MNKNAREEPRAFSPVDCVTGVRQDATKIRRSERTAKLFAGL
jgi:hypothetical protein